jgi:hypothetical protein
MKGLEPMNTEDSEDPKAALHEDLRKVEAELAQVRHMAAELRRHIGERWFEPTDQPERAALITSAEEQEALAEELEARRSGLLKRLEESR